MLYFLLSTLVLTLYIDVVLSLSICMAKILILKLASCSFYNGLSQINLPILILSYRAETLNCNQVGETTFIFTQYYVRIVMTSVI